MIVFDLKCAAGHVFEAWFGSSDDYASQQERGLVTCPICGVGEVGKAVMAPRVSGTGDGDDSRRKLALRALAAAQAAYLSQSENVGGDFARRARAMHEGDETTKPIYGTASLPEVKGLIEDGVPVAPLPLPARAPGTDN